MSDRTPARHLQPHTSEEAPEIPPREQEVLDNILDPVALRVYRERVLHELEKGHEEATHGPS